MNEMKRYAIFYPPPPGGFADAAAAWLGWAAQVGQVAVQPAIASLPRPMADLTAAPRRYGFHGTIKPPFRLAAGVSAGDLAAAVQALAGQCRPVALPGLQMVDLEGFLAFVPDGDASGLAGLAAEVVRVLDPYRAALTEAETARRHPDRLTPRQRDLLAIYGYPYVMEEFRFHLTLSGPLAAAEHPTVAKAAATHFAGRVPQPFQLTDLSLMDEDAAGCFHLLHRYPLGAWSAASSRAMPTCGVESLAMSMTGSPSGSA